MITASQIREAEFSRSGRGYKTSEVDDLLEEAALTIDKYQKENEELTRKLSVLAEKIKEYRADEENIKQALVTAQRTADSIVRDAKAEAEKNNAELTAKSRELVIAAKTKADAILKEAEEKAAIVASETKERALSAIAEAKDKAGKMVLEVSDMRRKEMAVLEEMKRHTAEFRVELLNMYKAQVELINKLPETIDLTYNAPKEEIDLPDTSNITVADIDVPHEELSVEIPYTDEQPSEEEKIETPEIEETPETTETAGFFNVTPQTDETEARQGFSVQIPEKEQERPSKFGKLKFGDDYDPEDDDDDDDFDDEDDKKHSFFRRKK